MTTNSVVSHDRRSVFRRDRRYSPTKPNGRGPLVTTHAATSDLQAKGLSTGAVGLLASVVLSVSSVAPVYALTATLGPTVTEVGLQMPAIFLAGFLPMLLVACSYRELNKVIPDCGTSFTWSVKAFGPRIGWMCGWGLLVATVVVLSNLAGVAT